MNIPELRAARPAWHAARSRGALMKSAQAGYTLAEVLTVVAIVGILSLVTVPAFMNFRTSNKVKSSVRTFTTELRRTRQLAITNGRESKLSFATGTSGGARSYN